MQSGDDCMVISSAYLVKSELIASWNDDSIFNSKYLISFQLPFYTMPLVKQVNFKRVLASKIAPYFGFGELRWQSRRHDK